MCSKTIDVLIICVVNLRTSHFKFMHPTNLFARLRSPEIYYSLKAKTRLAMEESKTKTKKEGEENKKLSVDCVSAFVGTWSVCSAVRTTKRTTMLTTLSAMVA